MKIITFSFDDGEIQDIRLTDLLRKYGLKATFGLTSGYFGKSGVLANPINRERYQKVAIEDLNKIYEGFEVCSHGAMHRGFVGLSEQALRKEVYDDNQYLQKIFGKDCIGTIYPGGGYDASTVDLLRKLGICYARTTDVTYDFEVPEDFLMWHPTCSFMDKRLLELWKKFVVLPNKGIYIFHIYGHSYELDFKTGIGWKGLEEFFQMIASAKDVLCYTCGEDYNLILKG